MKQIITTLPTAQDFARMDRALDQLEAAAHPLITLDPARRKRLVHMGDKSEAFGRQALDILSDNPGLAPPTFDLATAQATLQARDQLRLRMNRLERLRSRMQDSLAAMGVDVFAAARKAYRLLQLDGNVAGLDVLKASLSRRFRRVRPKKPESADAA